MRKTIEKEAKQEVKTEVKEEKKEFTLQEAFVLWRNKSKAGDYYLSGYTSEECGSEKLIGYFNTNKNNPKEPDVRVYSLDSEGKRDKEVASLWESIDRNEKRYLTGNTDEKEKLVAWYGKENEEARPYIRAYFREN